MKKYLHIPLALLLIVLGIWGCTMNRPRPLISCFPSDDWTAVSAERILPGEGSAGALDITPEQLKEAMAGISVRPRSSFHSWIYDTVFLHIQAQDTTLSLKIGENGDITIAQLPDEEDTRTCWRAEDGSLYEALLAFSVY